MTSVHGITNCWIELYCWIQTTFSGSARISPLMFEGVIRIGHSSVGVFTVFLPKGLELQHFCPLFIPRIHPSFQMIYGRPWYIICRSDIELFIVQGCGTFKSWITWNVLGIMNIYWPLCSSGVCTLACMCKLANAVKGIEKEDLLIFVCFKE